MIDYHGNIITALNTILPTHYEMNLKTGAAVPCISYMELNNYVSASGNTLGYSKITYQVKVWANDIVQIQKYAMMIDTVLRPLGWVRIASGEMYDNQSTMIQKIMTYEALASETY